MASLLGELQESGSRLSDGSPNAGGKCWFYQPGTTTPVNVYTDADLTAIATQPVVLDLGGRIPPADYPDGIWLTRKVRLYVEDSGGGVVSDTTYTPADANNSNLTSDYFTSSTIKGALESIGSSGGGIDGKYLQSLGATPRTTHDKFQEIWISVKDKGAVGDGVAIDTTGIQAAVNAVIAAGGGVVYFPPGTYKVDGAITMTSGTGVRIIGAGYGATTIVSTHATANMFTLDSCTACEISNIALDGTSTGKIISADDCPDLLVRGVNMIGTYAYGIDATGTTNALVYDSFIVGSTRSIRHNVNGTEGPAVYNSVIDGSLEYLGGTHDGKLIGNRFASGSILFAAAMTGTGFTIVGNRGASAITVSATIANDPLISQYGNGLDLNAYAGASGSTLTPVFVNGARQILFTATTSAAGTVTVAAPAVMPSAFDSDRIYWIRFRNALGGGGAVTWSLNAVYVLVGGAAPAGADGTTVTMGFIFDTTTSEFREICRATTTT